MKAELLLEDEFDELELLDEFDDDEAAKIACWENPKIINNAENAPNR